MRAVRIERLGSVADLVVRELPRPEPGPGEVRVRVLAAGLNPVDWKIVERPGSLEHYGPGLALPLGNGNDLAGIVDAVGPGAERWQPGDEVFGGRRFHAQADFAIVPADRLLSKPAGLTFEQAGSLDIAGRTAVATMRAVRPRAGETVFVSAAAGGVGMLSAQLARRAGARVIGSAGEANDEALRELGIEPVRYGPGLADRVRALAPSGVDAVIDTHGRETMEAAIELGVDPDRIDTIADKAFAEKIGAHGAGGETIGALEIAELAELIAAGEVRLEIDAVYPIERVVEAYAHLKAGHLRGKVVLVTE
ncbi:NADP-dependent oxidoreductase [Agromyces archimandritae]|uniref:NADP-dependent oxidoreductase n=1 Tax=Agromyces archimandritae TaxID=2781962 RepID=A0A975IQI1_9MICO|nr:NADP-dependent oxidoreductase [Agromyces archimandritae]QTX05061.1 NADP-dependent oxidoreductase [Agromyces archimandritae]